ncbi:NUDIX domain-containing protein [Candidatus Woesearchaeota archaeon]|nr:NUDIX domain-containing protein [Candidatus Woesearchaeota archaeon]
MDDDDNVLRQVAWKEMHEKNLTHRAANIFVFNSKGRIFLHRRNRSLPLYPGMYDVKAGGVVRAGESYEKAAGRELKEELGIEGAELEYLFDLKFRSSHNNNNRKVYRCVYDGKIRLQKEEVEEGKFITVAEAKKMLQEGKLSPSATAVFNEYLKRQK